MRLNLALLLLPITFLAACGGETTSTSTGGGGQTTMTTTGGGSGGEAGTMGAGAGGSGGMASTGGAGTGGAGGGGGGGAGGALNVPLSVLGEGVWIFGWSGGLDHYSWVRFQFANQLQGSIDVMDTECVSCTPYYPCEGKGSFSTAPESQSLVLDLPAACNTPTTGITFGPFESMPLFPPSATLHSALTDTNGQTYDAFQLPASFCAADFSTCSDPFM